MQPLAPKASLLRLQRFCVALGWDAPLTMHRTPRGFYDRQSPSLMRYFYTMYEMDSPVYIQINPQTNQHPRLFAMNIFAMRYRLCTGWHGFMIDRHLSKEVQRVLPWLHGRNFATQASRALLRMRYPEFSEYNWKRIRDTGPPYTQNTTYARWLECSDSNSAMNRGGGSSTSM